MRAFVKLLIVGSLAAGIVPVLAPPATAATPDVVDLSGFQTGIRNQQDRGTCAGFAMVAAIEARYKRDHGLTLDLSEQYHWHTYKSTGVENNGPFLYENQSSFWGGGGPDFASATTYAIPTEEESPYLNNSAMAAVRDSIPGAGKLEWQGDPALNTVTQSEVDAFEYSPNYIPPAARANARFGVAAWTAWDTATVQNTTRVEEILASGKEIAVGVSLKWKWNADRTIHVYDPTVDYGGHVFLVVGYNRPGGYFLVKNSWGESNLLKVSYDFFRNAVWNGATVDAVTDPTTPSRKGRFLGVWNVDVDGRPATATIRRATNAANARTRLGHVVSGSGSPQALNGFTTDGTRGVRFSVENAVEPPLDQMNGTQHQVTMLDLDTSRAAGDNVWSGTPFGTLLSRSPLARIPSSSFTRDEWIGAWSLNDNGQLAKLTITGFNTAADGTFTTNGFFRDPTGVQRLMVGRVRPARPHVLELQLVWPGGVRVYSLHHHTWEDKVVSGYRSVIGERWGVVATRS